MANFNTSNTTGSALTLSSTAQGALGLTAATATLTQGALIDVSMSQSSAPSTTDGPVVWSIDNCTTLGTGTAVTPTPTQGGWRASGAVCRSNYTVAPTLTTNLYKIAINQRASYRWMPVPGSELYWPATNLAGVYINAASPVASSYAGAVVCTATHTE